MIMEAYKKDFIEFMVVKIPVSAESLENAWF